MTLQTLEVPAKTTPTALVVWLHGLGASGQDFVPVAPMMELPHVHWVFPNAPLQAVTINGGVVMPSWYDIRSMEPGPGREDIGQLKDSAAAVERVIQANVAAHSIPENRVVIAGFSQGGAVAMELLTQGERAFAGGAILSSYWATPEVSPTPSNAATPTFFGHGSADGVVPMARGREAHDGLQAAGRTVSWQNYPMGHEVCIEELQHMRAALHRWIG